MRYRCHQCGLHGEARRPETQAAVRRLITEHIFENPAHRITTTTTRAVERTYAVAGKTVLGSDYVDVVDTTEILS